jgi:hypothetical protein
MWTSYCIWRENDSGGHCKYDEPRFDIKAVVLVSIVVAILTAPVNFLVDFLFVDILSAQTEDEVKAKANQRKLISQFANAANVVRRASLASSVKVNEMRKSIVGREIVKIPEITSSAQILAVQSTNAILGDAQKRLSFLTDFREKNRSQILVDRQKKNQERKQQVLDRERIDTLSGSHGNRWGRIRQQSEEEKEIVTRFSAFAVDVVDQRKLLKPKQRDRFDARWGIDPTGEFSRQWTSGGLKSSEQLLKDEMRFVLTETKKKIKKLESATDSHIGLELLHQFLLDILGRDTPAAKIFFTKSQQDFAHSYVLPRYVKFIAWVVVLLVNLFFIYFSMLRALERGYAWQRLFAIACVLQLIVEIVFYETSEAIFLHFVIPNLARVEVQTATVALRGAINEICQQQSHEVILNSPQYFFVSTNVAKHFPHLLESVLIQSYRSCWPGELGRKWKFDHGLPSLMSSWNSPLSTGGGVVRSLTLSALLTTLLQHLGATAPAFQKFCIHSIQPLLVSVIFLLGKFVLNHPLYFLVFIPPVGYLCYLYSNLEPKDDATAAPDNQIHPLPSTPAAHKKVTYPAAKGLDSQRVHTDNSSSSQGLGIVSDDDHESQQGSSLSQDEDEEGQGQERDGKTRHNHESWLGSSNCSSGDEKAASRFICEGHHSSSSESWSDLEEVSADQISLSQSSRNSSHGSFSSGSLHLPPLESSLNSFSFSSHSLSSRSRSADGSDEDSPRHPASSSEDSAHQSTETESKA